MSPKSTNSIIVDYAEIGRTWKSLNEFLSAATEDQANALLQRERAGSRRLQFMIRCYGRYNKLRQERERKELIQEHAL